MSLVTAPAPQSEPRHIPVLMKEVLELLAPRAGQTLLDCTAGLGGHAAAIAASLGPTGTVILNDHDPANLERAAARVRAIPGAPAVVSLRGNFADAPRRMVEGSLRADLVLADLGFATSQMEDASRGFSFMREGPLDMRLDPQGPSTAADLVNSLPEQELAEILRDMGEEPSWRAIARKLVEERKSSPITTTGRLASIVRSVASQRGGPPRIDPATRTFQALRIVVNDELGSLRSLLEAVLRAATILGRSDSAASTASSRLWLAPAARIAVISFHSLEDRLVKQEFGELHKRGAGRELTRKPAEASEQEVSENPRSRSAKLRVVEIIGAGARVV